MPKKSATSKPHTAKQEPTPKIVTDEIEPEAISSWLISIPNWTPASMNKGRGRHWSVGADVRQGVADMIGVYAHKAGVKKVSRLYQPVRRVSMNVYHYGNPPDPDNILKYTLDALKGCSLIVNDTAQWCHWRKPAIYPCAKGKEHTVISIADVSVGMWFELQIVARHFGVDRLPQRRDVYLFTRDPREPAARMAFLLHVDCPLPTVLEIMDWAKELGYAIVLDPPGNAVPDWKFPEEVEPTKAAKPTADPALLFE